MDYSVHGIKIIFEIVIQIAFLLAFCNRIVALVCRVNSTLIQFIQALLFKARVSCTQSTQNEVEKQQTVGHKKVRKCITEKRNLLFSLLFMDELQGPFNLLNLHHKPLKESKIHLCHRTVLNQKICLAFVTFPWLARIQIITNQLFQSFGEMCREKHRKRPQTSFLLLPFDFIKLSEVYYVF